MINNSFSRVKELILLVAAGFLILVWSCDREDEFITSSDVKLTFSVDTLRFDTVFTELGSATRFVKVYNSNDKSVLVSNIYVDGGSNTQFRLNVDGIPGNEVKNIQILPNDSIYIFSEVTVDPDQPLSISPFIIEDKIILETNGNAQEVILEAWGQNANYFPSRFNKGIPVLLSCDFGEITWDDPKPYVIYGEIFIDSCTLNIPAGTQIYVHGGIAENEVFGIFNDGIIWVFDEGKLNIQGTNENPVVIQGDRLETSFQDDPGQWTGIVLGRGSKGNKIEYTTIKNSTLGVYVDSLAELSIKNSQIYNTASSALVGFHSKITAENCLFYNNFSNSIQILLGGDYNFNYCTIASYGVDANAVSLSNFFCYDDPFNCNVFEFFRLNANFKNCIIFGSRKDELDFLDISGGQTAGVFNVNFENCVVKVEELLTQQDGLYADFLENQCNNCINGSRDDLLFLDTNEDNYHLDSLSIAIGQAKVISGIIIDLENKTRDTEKPDVGCYERE